jgi:energy-converting hydrogenase A subunit D
VNLLLAGICCLITCIGGVYAGTVRDPYAKLIGIGVIGGGVMPLIVARGYADVAAALALIIPLSTIFILQVCRKGEP